MRVLIPLNVKVPILAPSLWATKERPQTTAARIQ